MFELITGRAALVYFLITNIFNERQLIIVAIRS